jgi:hypothetical protein
METYYLNTLLHFFHAQHESGYDAIETILGIIKDGSFSNEDKKDGILFILHKHGLNETTHKKGRYEPRIEKWKLNPGPIIDMEFGKDSYYECFMTQITQVHMMNGAILIEFGLN